jgi:hypothetical protein
LVANATILNPASRPVSNGSLMVGLDTGKPLETGRLGCYRIVALRTKVQFGNIYIYIYILFMLTSASMVKCGAADVASSRQFHSIVFIAKSFPFQSCIQRDVRMDGIDMFGLEIGV